MDVYFDVKGIERNLALRVVVWVNLRWKSDFKGLFAGEILVFVSAQTGYAC